ncbi:MAG: hypothetical protein KIH01_07020 [Candidatus Freyarchaeota archaeon]|nr:hypothetical protein [Candidatus Jordarchaeia archaeon]
MIVEATKRGRENGKADDTKTGGEKHSTRMLTLNMERMARSQPERMKSAL